MKNLHWIIAGLLACLIPVLFLWTTWPTGREINVAGYGKPATHPIHGWRTLQLQASQTTTAGGLGVVYKRGLTKVDLPSNTPCSLFPTGLKVGGAIEFAPLETEGLTHDWHLSGNEINLIACGNIVPTTLRISHKCLHGDSPAVARIGRSAELRPIIAEVK